MTVQFVEMTEAEYKALPEFAGGLGDTMIPIGIITQLTHGRGMCPSCGAGLVPIRSKLPGGEDRLVCATCLQERLESRNASPIPARLRALRRELDALYRLADAKAETTTDDWAKIALAIDEAEQGLEVIEKAVETEEREAEAQ